MNIYVAEFKENEDIINKIYNVGIDIPSSYWWLLDDGEEFTPIYNNFKKGDIVKFIYGSSANKILGYCIIKENFIYQENNDPIYGMTGTNTINHLRLPIISITSVTQAVNYYIDFSKTDHDYSGCIFMPCIKNTTLANSKPYSFIIDGIISDYISFQWNDMYTDSGTFSLVLPSSQNIMDLLQEDRFLLIGESERVMIIEQVKFNSNLKSDGYIVTATGRSLESILERRVAFPGQGLNTNEYKGENGLCKAIYDLVDHFFIHPEEIVSESSDGQKMFYYPERRVPFLALPSEEDRYTSTYIKRPFRASVNKVVSKDNLLKIIGELCKNENLGFKIVPKQMVEETKAMYWEFSLYTGKDKSYSRANKEDPLLLFSPVLGNVEAIATTKNISNYRNVILCGKEKESDGYINLTTNTSDALDYKTGIEIIDTFNSGVTSLISGVKDQLVTKLENSEVAYTGVLFIAVAASFTDKDYQATVTSIKEKSANLTKLYVKVDDDSDDRYSNGDNAMKIRVRIKKTSDIIGSIANDLTNSSNYKDDFLSFILSGKIISETVNNTTNYYREIFILPSHGEKVDMLGIYGNQTGITYEKYFIDDTNNVPKLSINYRSENDLNIGELIFKGQSIETDKDIPLYDFDNSPLLDERGNVVVITLHPKYVNDDSTGTDIKSYPSDYISKSRAENIFITFRHAFGDKDMASSKKTDMFCLSDISSFEVEPEEGEIKFTFKTSTEMGWFTIPILKQATMDLNNTTFAKLSMAKKSAIQAWFKTFDKYTTNMNQMRWLCQEYKYGDNNEGLNRREVFVEEDNSESDEWNASAINSFQSSTVTLSVDQEDDEESDEKINERLLESARKRSGDYRKVRDVDATFDLGSYKYMSNGQNGYDIGDIVQVDDGWDNLDRFYIAGLTISNDTNNGPVKVPTFERYEDIPKEYRKIDYLQVANMILPAKFNRRFDTLQDADEVNLPSNMYFSKTDVGPINSIKSESIGVITDIECDLQYIQKTSVNNEDISPLKPVFALISAIGSEKRKGANTLINFRSVNMPMVLLTTKYKSPFFFMTEFSDEQIYTGEQRYLYMYICNQGIERRRNGFLDWDNFYGVGVGYKNKNILDQAPAITDETIQNFVYRQEDDGKNHKYFINKLHYDKSRYTNSNNTIVEDDDHYMYYSSTYVDEYIDPLSNNTKHLSDRPLSRAWYKENVTYIHTTSETIKLNNGDEAYLTQNYNKSKCFVDSSTLIGANNNIALKPYINVLNIKLDNSIKPKHNNSYKEVRIDETYWGQDNYRLPKNIDETNDDLEREYKDILYENHIVLGGAAFYAKDTINNTTDYYLKFYDCDVDPNLLLSAFSPKACDTNNGVRINGSIKIYETISSTRQISFRDDDKRFYAPNNDDCYKLKYLLHVLTDVTSNNYFYSSKDVLAYYPDLSTRKVVHEYVPVVYTEGGNDILKEEQYGLYDIIDRIFVPINWGDNENATFIEAGGEIKNE